MAYTGVGKAIAGAACDGSGNAVFLVLNFAFENGVAIGLSLSSTTLSCACCGGGGGGGGVCCCVTLDAGGAACCESSVEHITLTNDQSGSWCRSPVPPVECVVASTDCIKDFYVPGFRFKSCNNSSATAKPCLQTALLNLVNCHCLNVSGVGVCVAGGTLLWDGTGPYTTPPGGGC